MQNKAPKVDSQQRDKSGILLIILEIKRFIRPLSDMRNVQLWAGTSTVFPELELAPDNQQPESGDQDDRQVITDFWDVWDRRHKDNFSFFFFFIWLILRMLLWEDSSWTPDHTPGAHRQAMSQILAWSNVTWVENQV